MATLNNYARVGVGTCAGVTYRVDATLSYLRYSSKSKSEADEAMPSSIRLSVRGGECSCSLPSSFNEEARSIMDETL